MHLAVANLTGAIRLLIGLGWPMIYFVAAFFGRKQRGRAGGGPAGSRMGSPRRPHDEPESHRLPAIELEREHAIEIVGLVPPLVWFFVIWLKGFIAWWDAVVLVALYVAYLVVLLRVPPHEEEELADAPAVSRWAYGLGGKRRVAAITGLFLGGGALLYFTAEPFLESMIGIAAVLGVSDFVFVQWVAPFLSEFPEKVSAFYWAKRVDKAPMALMNLVSSNINQWTILAAMIPLVFGWSHAAAGHGWEAFTFDRAQELEIALTLAQSVLALLLLMEMRFQWWDAAVLFLLWLVQFLVPSWRHPVLALYLLWSAALILGFLTGRLRFSAPRTFLEVWREGRSRAAAHAGNAAPRA